jgi:hypothetical protein
MTAEGEGGRAAARERFIPVRKAELLDALIEHGALASEAERVQFRHICRSLAAIFHYRIFRSTPAQDSTLLATGREKRPCFRHFHGIYS